MQPIESQNMRRRKTLTDEDWRARHLYDGEDWIEGYWKSYNHPHRSFLVEEMSKFSPINNVLEIGCASGPNLYAIAKRFPEAQLRGIDINPLAVQRGNEWFREECIANVKLEVGEAQELEHFEDREFDIVLTDAVLIYITPDEIEQVIKEMLRISRILMLNEWHVFNKRLAFLWNAYCYFRLGPRTVSYLFRPKASLGLNVGHWARDYVGLFQEFVPKEKVHIIRLPKGLWDDKGWQTWGALIEVQQ
jgi:SAM-dependent methyltransferase